MEEEYLGQVPENSIFYTMGPEEIAEKLFSKDPDGQTKPRPR